MPKKPLEEIRLKKVLISLTCVEYAKLRYAAELSDMAVSVYARTAALAAANVGAGADISSLNAEKR